MSGTVVILVNGEVLANGSGIKIPDQRENTRTFARAVAPILTSDLGILVLHGNKPQVGFVLFRSEIAGHALHTIPLDVCGADTQGATGYMLMQEFHNILALTTNKRNVMCLITQTVVDDCESGEDVPKIAVGPRFDRDKAEQYRQLRGWTIAEESGRGYRRTVPSLTAKEVVEIEGINRLINAGDIVIAGGGGGIPVIRDQTGELRGIEAVVETEQVACMLAEELKAKILLMVLEKENHLFLSRFFETDGGHLTINHLDHVVNSGELNSRRVKRHLNAALFFLQRGGEQVILTTLEGISNHNSKGNKIVFGSENPSIRIMCIPNFLS